MSLSVSSSTGTATGEGDTYGGAGAADWEKPGEGVAVAVPFGLVDGTMVILLAKTSRSDGTWTISMTCSHQLMQKMFRFENEVL